MIRITYRISEKELQAMLCLPDKVGPLHPRWIALGTEIERVIREQFVRWDLSGVTIDYPLDTLDSPSHLIETQQDGNWVEAGYYCGHPAYRLIEEAASVAVERIRDAEVAERRTA